MWNIHRCTQGSFPHACFWLTTFRRTLRTEAAPLNPAGQLEFPSCEHQGKKKRRRKTVIFNPAWRRFWTKLRPVGVGCDQRTSGWQLSFSSVRAQLGRGNKPLVFASQSWPQVECPVHDQHTKDRQNVGPFFIWQAMRRYLIATDFFCIGAVEALLRRSFRRRSP